MASQASLQSAAEGDLCFLLASRAFAEADRLFDSIRAHLGGSATQHYELPIVSKFGTRRFLEVSTRIIYRRGHPIAIQGTVRAIWESLDMTRTMAIQNGMAYTHIGNKPAAERVGEPRRNDPPCFR